MHGYASRALLQSAYLAGSLDTPTFLCPRTPANIIKKQLASFPPRAYWTFFIEPSSVP